MSRKSKRQSGYDHGAAEIWRADTLESRLLLSAANGFSVLANDSDPNGDQLTAVLVEGPQFAAEFELHADGTFDYVHDGGDDLVDTFTYRAFDGVAYSNVATVTITVDVPVQNDPPLTQDDAVVMTPPPDGDPTDGDPTDGNPTDGDPTDGEPNDTVSLPPELNETGTFPRADVPTVDHVLETDDSGDADDPALWIHPTDPARSLLLGSDKGAGIHVFDATTGEELSRTNTASSNNVDVRYGFELDGEIVDIASASNRDNNRIDVFRIDGESRSLEQIGSIETGISVYGHALFHDRESGRFFALVSSKSGVVEQWELIDNNGAVEGTLVGSFDAGGQVEGLAADDELGFVYVGEEDLGLWKYDTVDGVIVGNGSRTEIDTAAIDADLEGIALYYRRDGQGYLLVSSQGNTQIAVYRREGSNEWLGNFRVNGASGTDGIDVTNRPFGSWNDGVLAIHQGASTYEVVPWRDVAETLGLAIDTTGYDVREVSNGAPAAEDDDLASPPASGGDSEPPAPPVSAGSGIFISPAVLMALQTEGPAWDQLVAAASAGGQADLSDQHHAHNTNTLAAAIVGVRLNDESLKQHAREEIMEIIETENGGRTLALARNLLAYVVAADLVGLPAADDAVFRKWLDGVRFEELSGKTLISTHEDRPNNWGTHAGASRMAADLYLGDMADFERAVQVFRGWLGDREAYAGFDYGDLSWQADPGNPVGINPAGSVKDGVNIDGVIPDDQRRGGSFPRGIGNTGYPWAALNGVVAQAELAFRQGHDVYNWSDQAILRSVAWLYEVAGDSAADEDEAWIPWVIDHRYGTDFASDQSGAAHVGKSFGFTDWLYMPTVDDVFAADPQVGVLA